jgi:hypothetical protein
MRSRWDGGGRVHNQLLLLPRDRDDCMFPIEAVSRLHSHTRHFAEGLGIHPEVSGAGVSLFAALVRRQARGVPAADGDCTGSGARVLDAAPVRAACAGCGDAPDRGTGSATDGVAHRSRPDRRVCVCCERIREFGDVPISTEWTVQFGKAVFHFRRAQSAGASKRMR